MRARGHEVIVADGGSTDATAVLAEPLCDRVIEAPRGRARVHLPHAADELMLKALGSRPWGRFDVEIEGRHPLLGLVAGAMNARSRLTGIATGDQAIFVRREAFGGFPEIALMEDIAFSRAMKRVGAPACLRAKVRTSGRRWESRGVLRTIGLMWRLRLAYFLGAHPDELARRYER